MIFMAGADLSLGIFASDALEALCEPRPEPVVRPTLAGSLIKKKKMTDFIKQLQFVGSLLSVVLVNKSVCFFDVNEKGEIIQLLKLAGDEKMLAQPTLVREDATLAWLQEKNSSLLLVFERPFLRDEHSSPTFKPVAACSVSKAEKGAEYLVNAKVWRREGITAVITSKKEGRVAVHIAYIPVK